MIALPFAIHKSQVVECAIDTKDLAKNNVISHISKTTFYFFFWSYTWEHKIPVIKIISGVYTDNPGTNWFEEK